MIGIYKITSKKDPSLFYVGKSNCIERRFKEHIQKSHESSRIPFDEFINKANKDDFTFEVIEECELNQLSQKEHYWVKQLEAKKTGNKFDGGLTDVIGEHNPRAKLTEDDIKNIRLAYAEHLKQKDVYEKYKNVISFKYFQNIWQGKSWPHIMPEVFTEENKKYYIYENSKGENGTSSLLTNEEVIQIRKRYVNESAITIYNDYKDKIKYQTLQAILWGRYYTDLPIYKKKEKQWINV